MFNPDIPHNAGLVRPVEIIIPVGTILNAAYPAATTYGNHLCPNNADAIMRALSPVMPERVTAEWSELLCSQTTGLDNRPGKEGSTFVDICFMGLKGGSGGIYGCDGYDHIGMIDASGGVLDQDYEIFEQATPHRVLHHEYWEDSAGAGRWRGGIGVETRLELHGRDLKLITFGDGDVEPSFGSQGGREGTLNIIQVEYPGEPEWRTLTTKDLVQNVPDGTLYFQQAVRRRRLGRPPAAAGREGAARRAQRHGQPGRGPRTVRGGDRRRDLDRRRGRDREAAGGRGRARAPCGGRRRSGRCRQRRVGRGVGGRVMRRSFMPALTTEDELAAVQLAGLQWTVGHAYHGSDFYRARFDAAGVRPEDIRTLDDLRRLPFTTASDLREGYPFPLRSVPFEQIVRVHSSSGTTGLRKVLSYTQKDVDDWRDLFARCYEMAGVGPGDRVQLMVGYGLWTAGVGFQAGCEAVGATAIPIGPGNLDMQAQFLVDLRAQRHLLHGQHGAARQRGDRRRGLTDKVNIERIILGSRALRRRHARAHPGTHGRRSTSSTSPA